MEPIVKKFFNFRSQLYKVSLSWVTSVPLAKIFLIPLKFRLLLNVNDIRAAKNPCNQVQINHKEKKMYSLTNVILMLVTGKNLVKFSWNYITDWLFCFLPFLITYFQKENNLPHCQRLQGHTHLSRIHSRKRKISGGRFVCSYGGRLLWSKKEVENLMALSPYTGNLSIALSTLYIVHIRIQLRTDTHIHTHTHVQ